MKITKEMGEQIVRLYKTHSDTELSKMLGITIHCLTDYRHRKGLFKEKKVNPRALKYSEKLWIEQNYMKLTYKQMAEALKRGKSIINKYVKVLFERGFAKKPNSSHKNLRLVSYLNTKPNKGSFKKGSLPHNTRKVGQVYWRNAENQYFIKTANGVKPFKNWLWEKENGTVQKGEYVCFIDGNSKNVCLENLCLLDRAGLLKKNNSGTESLNKRGASLKKAWAKRRFTEINGKNVWT